MSHNQELMLSFIKTLIAACGLWVEYDSVQRQYYTFPLSTVYIEVMRYCLCHLQIIPPSTESSHSPDVALRSTSLAERHL